MQKQIKFMLDYACSPLWHYESEQLGTIEPEDLPLSPELTKQLHDLADEYDAGLNWDNPSESKQKTEAKLQELEDRQLALALKLQAELSPEYKVVYFSEQTGKIVHLDTKN